MKFRTEYIPRKSSFALDPSLPVVLAGSCFSQNIAGKMLAHQWPAFTPLGVLYNPTSIMYAIHLMLEGERGLAIFESSLSEIGGVWHSCFFDSSFSALDPSDSIQEFKNRRNIFLDSLAKGNTLIVTFGTSLVYHRVADRTAVGNCHKQPSELFYRQRLTPSGIMSDWSVIIEDLRNLFPDLRIIFTVSPVRHLKDGMEVNSRSKAILLLAVEDIIKFNENTFYFPAYEIMNDDLRDYRFYASDMAHPSEEAVDYIWEKFQQSYLNPEGIDLLREGAKRFKASMHRPLTGAMGKPLSR